MQQPTVLILGARGRLGAALVAAFAQAQWQVIAQTRTAQTPPSPQSAQVRWVQADLNDQASLLTAARGASVVVHAMNPAAYTVRAWQQEAPLMMQTAMDLAMTLDATLLFPGNVYGYGKTMPQRLAPETPMQPSTALGRIRTALEQQLQATCHTGKLRAVVIRAGDFFGSGSGAWLDRVIVKRLGRGQVAWPTGQNLAHAWAYLPDLAQTFVRVAESLRQAPVQGLECLHFPGHTVTRQDWLDALTQAAQARRWLAPGQALRCSTVPWPVLRLLALVHPTLASLVAMRYLWETPHALDGRALAQRIGTIPSTPFQQAVQSALDALPPQALAASGTRTPPVQGPSSQGA